MPGEVRQLAYQMRTPIVVWFPKPRLPEANNDHGVLGPINVLHQHGGPLEVDLVRSGGILERRPTGISISI